MTENEVTTRDEGTAFDLIAKGRNTIRKYSVLKEGMVVTEWWDFDEKCWKQS